MVSDASPFAFALPSCSFVCLQGTCHASNECPPCAASGHRLNMASGLHRRHSSIRLTWRGNVTAIAVCRLASYPGHNY